MKLLKLLSAPFIITLICSTAAKAQTELKLPQLSGSVDSIQITVPGSGNLKLIPFSYQGNDSLQANPKDSLKFNKKPNYSAFNAPVSIPNSFKPQPQTATAAMPVLKIKLKKED